MKPSFVLGAILTNVNKGCRTQPFLMNFMFICSSRHLCIMAEVLFIFVRSSQFYLLDELFVFISNLLIYPEDWGCGCCGGGWGIGYGVYDHIWQCFPCFNVSANVRIYERNVVFVILEMFYFLAHWRWVFFKAMDSLFDTF